MIQFQCKLCQCFLCLDILCQNYCSYQHATESSPGLIDPSAEMEGIIIGRDHHRSDPTSRRVIASPHKFSHLFCSFSDSLWIVPKRYNNCDCTNWSSKILTFRFGYTMEIPNLNHNPLFWIPGVIIIELSWN